MDQVAELIDAQHAAVENGLTVPIEVTFSPQPDAIGTIAVYQQFMADILNQQVTLTNEYAKDLEAIGWYTILDPNRLYADNGFQESKQLVDNARKVAEKYKARSVTFFSVEIQNRIQELDLSADERRAFERGYKRGIAGSMPMHHELWELEFAVIDEVDNIIEFLSEAPKFWSIEDNQFMFDNQEHLNAFNEHLSTIELLVQRQSQLQNAHLDVQREKLNAF